MNRIMKALIKIAAHMAAILLPTLAFAQVPVSVSPIAHAQFLSNAGIPLASGCVFTFAAGTTTPQATYTDSTGTAQNTNPIILDAGGFANIWLTNQSYKFQVKSAGGVNCATGGTQWTVDGITGQLGMLSLTNIWSGTQTFNQPIVITPSVNQIVTGISPNQTILNFPAPSGAKALTFPNTTDTMVGRATTDTLINKTLTTPILNTPTINTPVLNGTPTGTSLNGQGTKLATSAALGGSLPVCTDGNGTLQTAGCSSPVRNVANFSAKAQVAAIGSTAVFTCSNLGAPSTCALRANYYIVTQTSGTGTTASVSIAWLDGETSVSQTVTSPTINLGAAGSVQQGSVYMELANGGTVNYSTTVGSIGTSKYSFYVFVEQLQ